MAWPPGTFAGQGGTPGAATVSDVASFEKLAVAERVKPNDALTRKSKPHPQPHRTKRDLPVPPRSTKADASLVATTTEGVSPKTVLPPLTSPSPSASFLGLADNGVAYNPDTSGAVGPNHLMVALNSEVRVQDRTGGEVSTISLDGFWSSLGASNCYDPRVLYDPYGQRWILNASANPGGPGQGLVIGVSQTADPTGSWRRYFVAITNQAVYADSPALGFSKNWIVVAANLFDLTNGALYGSYIYAFNKTNLYGGGAGLFTRFSFVESVDAVHSCSPAITYDSTLTTNYLVQTWNANYQGFGYLRIYSIVGPVGAERFIDTDSVGLEGPFVSRPSPWEGDGGVDNFAPQLGTTNKIVTGDDRIQNLVYRDSTLFAAHTVYLPANAPTRCAVQFWEFSPGATVVQFARIDDAGGTNFFAYPSMAVNRDLDVLLGYTRFSRFQYPSANYSFRRGNDSLSVLRSDIVLKGGEGQYTVTNDYGLVMWGDWSATTVDAVNDTDLWTLQEYGAASVTNSDRWGTWWGRVSPPNDLGVTVEDSPDPVLAGANLTYTITVTNNFSNVVSGVRITNTLPVAGTFVSASNSYGVCSLADGVVVCDLGTLGGREARTMAIVATVGRIGLNTNVVRVAANGPELNVANNTASAVTTGRASADLEPLLTASPDPAVLNNSLTYVITVTNHGPTAASGVTNVITLPASATYVSSTPSQGSCSRSGSVITCNLGSIAYGSAATVTVVATPTAGGLITNVANVTTRDIDPVPENNLVALTTLVSARPTMSTIANQTINEDGVMGPVSFTVGDAETPAADLVVTARSSNQGLLADADIVLGGSGANRTITARPLANQSGTTTITRIVRDGDGVTFTNTFLLTVNAVNDAPVISGIAGQTISEESTTGPLPFRIGDVETAAASLTLTKASTNTTLVPVANIVFGGTGSNRTVTVTPATNRFGRTLVTVTVSDGALTANTSFLVTVDSVNDQPTITTITDRTVNEDTPTSALALTVGDVETAAGSLTVTGVSTNTTLVPLNNIVLGGTGGNRTVTVTPATNQFGTTLITLSVTDADGGSTNSSFRLTVNPVNDPPTLDTLANLTIVEDASLQVVNLTGISSGATNETQAVTVTPSTVNTTLITNLAVAYNSPDSTGTLSFNTVANANGTATITLTLNDGGSSNNITTRSFTVVLQAVNDLPAISEIADQTINEDTVTAVLPVAIGDVETAATSLTLSGTSSDTNLVPVSRITFGGSGANRTVTVRPATNAFGTATISVAVSDGTGSNTADFVLTVNSVNDLPTIQTVADRTISEDTVAGPVSFAVGDVESAADVLALSAESSNAALAAGANIAFGGSGSNRNVTVTPTADAFGATTITLFVTDGDGGVSTEFFLLTVASVNDPPTLDAIADVTMNEGDPPMVVGLTGITTGAGNEAQTLTVTAISSTPAILPNPTVNYTSPNGTGTLTLAPPPNAYGTATVTVTVTDNGGGSNRIQRTFGVTIIPLNDPPTITAIANQTINEDLPTAALAFQIGDPETAPSALNLVAFSSNEELVANTGIVLGGSGSNRTVTVHPLTNQYGSATITLQVTDPQELSTTSLFSLEVVPINDVPSISALPDLTANEDTPVGPLNFAIEDAETSPDLLTVVVTSSNPTLVPNANLQLEGSGVNRTLVLTPATNQFGTATITLRVGDGGLTNTEAFVLTVSAVNDLPTVTPLANQTMAEDGVGGPLSFQIGDVETAAASLTLAGLSSDPVLVPVANITFGGSASNRTVTVRPATNQFGSATIAVTTRDANGGVTTNAFDLTVTPVNDLPVLAAVSNQTTSEDVPRSVFLNLYEVETPPASLGRAATSSNPTLLPETNIVFGLSGGTNMLTLTPAPDESGTATVTVVITDSDGADTSQSFLFTVQSVNDLPTLDPIADLAVNENAGLLTVSLTGISSGAPNENQALTVTATTPNTTIVTNLTVVYTSPATNGVLRMTTVTNANGTATISVTVNDYGASNNFVMRTFAVTVRPINTAPVISGILDRATSEDTATGAIAFTVGDAESTAGVLTVSAVSGNQTLVPDSGITLGGTGANRTVNVMPATNQFGRAPIQVVVSDGFLTATSRFEVVVSPVNDRPTISGVGNQTVPENSSTAPLAFTVGDVETAPADLLVLTGTSNPQLLPPSSIVLGGSGANRTATLTPGTNLAGTVNVTLTVVDANGGTATNTFTLTVTATNTPPSISSLPDQTVTEDTASGLLALAVDDVETAAASLTLSANSSNPALVPVANIVFGGAGQNRTVRFTPATNQFGTATLTLQVADAGGKTAGSSFTVTVLPVNDAPTLNTIMNTSVTEDAGLQTVNLAGIGSGATNEIQTLSLIASNGNPGLISNLTVNYSPGNTNGSLNFLPVANAFGSALITVTVNDGGGSNNLTRRSFLVTVNAVNDPPTLSDLPPRTIDEDTSLALPFTVSDPETPALRLTLSGTSTNTALVTTAGIGFQGFDTDRTLLITPVTNLFGVTRITVTVSDGTNSAAKSFLLTVNQVNDPPTFDPPTDLGLVLNAATQTVILTGIAGGPANESKSNWVFTAISSNTNLVPHPSISYTQYNTTAALRLKPNADTTGPATITVTLNDGFPSNNIASRTFNVFVRGAANTAPVISVITNRTVLEDTNTGPIAFTVGDAQTPAASLAVAAWSSNPLLVPNNAIVIGGSGSNRTLTITPQLHSSGTASLTVQVVDANYGVASTSFTLSVSAVNDPPTLSDIPPQTIAEDTPLGSLPLTLNDVDTPATSLTVTAVSTNQTLIPNGNLILGGSGLNRGLSLTPATNQSGSSLISLTVSDGSLSATSSFLVTVTGVNDPPSISDIADRTMVEDATSTPINFTIADAETANTNLTIALASSNPALLPTNGIALGGSGGSRSLTLTPIANESGTSLITVTVTDGNGATASDSFAMAVTALNDPPTLDAVASVSLNEDAGVQTILLTGISSGAPNEEQSVYFSVSSSNAWLIPAPTVQYTSPAETALLSLAPVANTNGTATITVTVNDSGATNSTTTRTFTVTVNAQPTISSLPVQVLGEDTTSAAVPFIVGDRETPAASLAVEGRSSNTTLLPDANISLGGSGANRTLTLRPATNQFGVTTVTLTVTDANNLSATSQFLLYVNAINEAPTLGPITDLTVAEDIGAQIVALSGITTGAANENQPLTLKAISSNPAILPDPAVTYTSPNTSGTLTLTPAPNANGAVTVTVRVDDGQLQNFLASQTFLVTINPINDSPTLDAIADLPVESGAGAQTLTLTGIGPGAANEVQTLTVTAQSSNPGLVPDPVVSYINPGVSGSLAFTPAAGTNGVAVITVTVKDDGGTLSGGQDTRTRSFQVTVQMPVPPTLGIQRVGTNVVVSWPAASSGYVLQRTTGFGAIPQWTGVTEPPQAVGDRLMVILPLSRNTEFFRLIRMP